MVDGSPGAGGDGEERTFLGAIRLHGRSAVVGGLIAGVGFAVCAGRGEPLVAVAIGCGGLCVGFAVWLLGVGLIGHLARAAVRVRPRR